MDEDGEAATGALLHFGRGPGYHHLKQPQLDPGTPR